MKTQYNLDLCALKWDFIKEFPVLDQGDSICDEFIDGLLYAQSIGEGITHQELLASMKKVFIENGLVLTKCDQKKKQSYLKKAKTFHEPYFCKLDDRGYDFTVWRLQKL